MATHKHHQSQVCLTVWVPAGLKAELQHAARRLRWNNSELARYALAQVLGYSKNQARRAALTVAAPPGSRQTAFVQATRHTQDTRARRPSKGRDTPRRGFIESLLTKRSPIELPG
jgi:hypothetical protein